MTNDILPNIGFCISEKSGLYIANRAIIGFSIDFSNGLNSLKMHTSNKHFTIYTYKSEDRVTFKLLANKIIIKIIESLRYNITANINIDKYIEEVLNDEKETSNIN